jgi:hypothetical protein
MPFRLFCYQNGLNPDKLFYTIVVVTLPYTGAMVLISLYNLKSSEHHLAKFIVSVFILLAGFWLGSALHWGINETEAAIINQQLEQASHTYKSLQLASHDGTILIQFYVTKYGLPLFLSATGASFVIAWNIMRWMEK